MQNWRSYENYGIFFKLIKKYIPKMDFFFFEKSVDIDHFEKNTF